MTLLALPGLIDTHVHLREPGATQKEDFETGTRAAIAGGYTCILDMPNNPQPTITPEALEKKIALAEVKIYSDVGFHFGATLKSCQYFQQIKNKVFGLKVYMNHTTGTLLQEDPDALQAIFENWPKDKVLMVHAEGQTLATAIKLASRNENRLHVCHVSQAREINLIRQAKMDGLSITCEVTCHHLFLTQEDEKRLGSYGVMRPPLATREDQEALWKGIKDGIVDTIASDHAPHTMAEKERQNPPFGVPGLETALPLLLTAVSERRLSIEDVIRLCHVNPAKIFNIPVDAGTKVEVDGSIEYEIKNENLKTKCGWSPFAGKKVKGKVKTVYIRGEKVFENGQVLAKPGTGKIISPFA